ncbi:MAG: hypothetical protein H6500_00550 [Candidatus Woesearchaeota archaeon]|nr:hypothetical protein [Nanoarchaeota archaeon]USN44322.1 MAG: hypothetical protein H6500_00550 [Candidatus Woesearchaeota archaeon]
MTSKRDTTELKVSLLSNGVNFPLDLFERYSGDFYENLYVYGKTSRVKKEHRIPQVLLLGDGVISALLRRENTPWSLRIEENKVNLYHNSTHFRVLELPEKPAYFGKLLGDGTPIESIVAVAGEDTPGYFLFPQCYYFDKKLPCGFCSLKGTRNNEGKHFVTEYNEGNISEATRIFQNDDWRHIPLISLTTGTTETDDENREKIIKPIKAMYDVCDPKIPIHLLAHPPNDFGLIDELKEAGVTTIAFNLEVFDREIFGKTCPGKEKLYGYDKWIDSLEYARNVFGDFNVYCGLVWGLEPPESTINGHRYFLERGINLASNIFHTDQKSVFGNMPHPSENLIMKIATAQDKMYDEFPEATTIFPVSMRSTIDWEIRQGYLK